MFKIYKLTVPNGKVYVGKTSLSLKERWDRGRNYSKNTDFFNDIVKYGWGNIDKVVLHETEDEELASELEIAEILKYKSNQKEYGYNKYLGNKMGEEQKRKQSERLKGRNPYWCYPKAHSKETIAKRTESMKRNGKLKGRYLGEKSAKARAVNMFTKSGQFIKRYGACSDAQRETGIDYGSIVKVCRKQRFSAGGYYWEYAD